MPDDSTPARVAPVDAPVATAPGEAAADVAEPSGHRHLDTNHLLPDIGRHAVSGGVFTAASQGVRFLLNLAAATVLARLLTPHDFGLVAMAGALMTILRAFRDGGLSTATVQRENITEAQVSNLFWINLVLGATITLLGAALAPGVAWFFHDDRITPIAIWLSLAFVLNGAAVQHLALLNRQMRFRSVAFIEITSATVSFVVGVVLAWLGWGYWALVGMQLMASLMDLVLIWSALRWMPRRPQRHSGTRSLLHLGASITVGALLQRLSGSADAILLGRVYGPAVVGLYSRAQVLLFRPLDQFMTPFDTVFVPILSRLQTQPDRYRQVFLQLYGAIALLSFTFGGLLLGLAEPVVLLLLGAQWTAVIPIFAWFSIAALSIPMSYGASWLLTTQGRTKAILMVGVVSPVLTVAAIALGLPFGATGVAITLSLMGVLIRLPYQYYVIGRSGPVRTVDLWTLFLSHLPVWILVTATAWLTRQALSSQPPVLQLAIGGAAGTLMALVIVLAWGRLRQEALFVIMKLRSAIQGRRKRSG